MCPIKGVSDARILPRLGKIRLGVKVERPNKNPYPQATDYFVCPSEVQAVFGEKPKALNIMFPSNDMEQVARQYLRCYGQTFGLVCWGDGEKCRRKVDVDNGDMAGRDTRNWEWRDMTCDYEECPEYGARCRRVMNLMFMLPDVPGLGVWQIDTTSFYSIREVNSTLGIITNLTKTPQFPEGRIAFIPLTLVMGPLEVSPRGISKKTVYIMHIRSDVKLADVVKTAMLPPGRVIVPEPEIEEAPDDLFPTELLEQQATEPAEAPPLPPEADLFGLVAERQELWTAIRKLMGEVHANEKAARSYFANVCDISVALEELAKETVPPALTIHMLKEFQQKLEQSRMNLSD
ncbi:hypothetical protein ES703_08925 [subsurface metagenome]